MAINDPHDRSPRRPRSEPEIIPPGAEFRERRVFVSIDEEGGRQRIFIAQPGPFTVFFALLLGALALAAIVLVLFGVLLFWIPVLILIVAAILLSGTIRYYWWRLRHFLASR
jgi:Flp pilus assembly protein TadB